MADNDIAKLLATRRHERLKEKDDIWKLIYQSYVGGIKYINEENLFQYRIEDGYRYTQRLKRADYTNHVAQLIDMLTGFIFAKEVKREIDEPYSYILNSIHKGKSLQSLMNMVASNCLKSTVGILVDSPKIDTEMSQADRKVNKINPYVVYYSYNQICDYEIDDNGELEWIILDNSFVDKTDPLKPEELKQIKRLWTKTYYQDITVIKDSTDNKYQLGEMVEHNLDKVPFIFINCKDVDEDYVCDSPFEDIAIKSRKVFNIASWTDEVLAGSSFQVLFMPYTDQSDIDIINALFDPQQGGIGDLPVIQFKTGNQPPFFAGPHLDNIDKHISLMEFYTDEILAKFGLKREEKGLYQSGVAKSLDFDKTEAFLRTVSEQLEQTERKIIELCGLYEGKEIPSTIEYAKDYEKEEITEALNNLSMAFTIPSKTVQTKAQLEIAKTLFPEMEDKELKIIEQELNSNNSITQEPSPLKTEEQSAKVA